LQPFSVFALVSTIVIFFLDFFLFAVITLIALKVSGHRQTIFEDSIIGYSFDGHYWHFIPVVE
jgi:hypothetical protein